MKKWLFLNDDNGFSSQNPRADLVQLDDNITREMLYILELSQKGVRRRGGSWQEIVKDGKLNFKLISSGRNSDYSKKDHDEIYHLVSGNY